MHDDDAALFAYGSLQVPEIFEAVTGLDLNGIPGCLDGFRCVQLRGFGFPGLIAAANAKTSGLIYRGLTLEAWQRLDAYEDGFYERRVLTAKLSGDEKIQVHVYVLAEEGLRLALNSDWSLANLDEATVRGLLSRL
jgi:gamma-glutamylcyclotransferase (GGCT)/AIG2-like uncharacterized protein YtfP